MDWKTKLTSRKFWMAVAGLVTGICGIFLTETDTTQISSVILSVGSVVAYIIGEGITDVAYVQSTKQDIQKNGE